MANKENGLIFKDAEKARDSIVESQKKEISKLYSDWADEIGEKATYYSHKTNSSAFVSERQMKELKKQLRETSQQVSNEIYSKTKHNIYLVADSVVQANSKWLNSMGLNADMLFSSVPDATVRNLVTGQIYDSGWSLSQRIWGDNEQTLKDIYAVIAKGVSMNEPIYDIAKNLEAYVKPGAKLPWNLTAKDGVKIFKKSIDYNAQRLARTLVQHGYQQSFKAVTEPNPLIVSYKWNSNGSRACDLCLSRNGKIYEKGDMPMDHPNGMCVMVPVVDDKATDKLADWMNSPNGTYPELDNFAVKLGYKAENKFNSAQDKYLGKYGFTPDKMPKKFDEWSHMVTEQDAGEILKSMGTSWSDPHPYQKLQQYYDKNLTNIGTLASDTTKGKPGTGIDTVDKFIEKYGTSKKTPSSWFNGLSAEQKAEAKLLKEQSGMTWNNWYEKNIYVGNKNKFDETLNNTKEFFKEEWIKSIESNSMRSIRKTFGNWVEKLSESERHAVRKYTGSGYSTMNNYLRGINGTIDNEYQSIIKKCSDAIKKGGTYLDKDIVVKRGSDGISLGGLIKEKINSNEDAREYIRKNKDSLIGKIAEDKGFFSTTPNHRGGFDGAIEYIVKVPKGANGAYLEDISNFPGEMEFLLDKGSRFVIQDIEYNSVDKCKVFMELIVK